MSTSSVRPRKLCKWINTPGGCRFGSSCHFSHDTSQPSPSSSQTRPGNRGSRAAGSTLFPQWERLISDEADAPSLGLRLPWFFDSAEKLISQDEETRQTVITRLASEGGLARIKEITVHVEAAVSSGNGTWATQTFSKELMPFMRTLAHQSVVASLLLESPRDTIINFLCGSNANRGQTVFNLASKQLKRKQDADGVDVYQDLEACMVILSKMLDLSSTATLGTGFSDIFDRLEATFIGLSTNDPDLNFSRCALHVNRVSQRLGNGASILASLDTSKRQPTAGEKPTFELYQDAPSHLSDQGARHDNDHVDIHDIQILPTASELKTRRSEYLPTTTFSSHCEGNIQGLLDKQFRLLREDTVGLLREGVKFEYERRKNPKHLASRNQQAAKTFAYHDAVLSQIRVDRKNGLVLDYEFTQPDAARARASPSDRKDWWLHSKRLQRDALTCLIDGRGSPLFCVVVDNGFFEKDSKNATYRRKTPAVFENQDRAYITLSLIEVSKTTLSSLLDGYIHGFSRGSEMLIEFPGVLLPAFRPTLQALKEMSRNVTDIPFADLLAASDGQAIEVKPPAYFLRRGFSLDLSCILHGARELRLSTQEPFDLEVLRNFTTLDAAQAESLKYALTHRIALIQGPPGTGKSFTGIAIMKTLVHNAEAAKLGPLICVTYTNHALDQILEHCHDSGIKQIIRIGSQSKSEVLENLNLREVVMRMELTRTEKQRRWNAKQTVQGTTQELDLLFIAFVTASSPRSIHEHLEAQYPDHNAQLFQSEVTDDEGFRVVGPYTVNPLENWLRQGDAVPDDQQRPIEVIRRQSLHQLNRAERISLYRSWIQEIRQDLQMQIWRMLVQFEQARNEMDRVRQEQELRCLRQAQIIGMTTSGLARLSSQLKHLNAKVVIMEEAGEVLEAHTLVTMLPSIEHAIFIGDHQQLRPQAQNYDLSVESASGRQYAFDISLFERLVAPVSSDAAVLPKRALTTQRRMHPSIAELIRSTLYPQLEDAENVTKYPETPGIRKRLFWFDHRKIECQKGTDVMATSHSNDFEVEMVVALVTHLMSQGCYDSKDVAVLTPYLGQLRKLRKALSGVFSIVLNDLDTADLETDDLARGNADGEINGMIVGAQKLQLSKSLRIATVDNFQGEEAKCVVISLVRSNEDRKCGFLRTTNRINVLLSRAQHSMYLIGNSDTYSSVKMWTDVILKLCAEANLGDKLELCCPRHPDTELVVKKPDDFATMAPQGGCSLRCVDRLGCGHACPSSCHSLALHESIRCLEACPRAVNGCDEHPCPKPCGDTCPKRCTVKIEQVELPCGHQQDLPCWETKDLDEAKCQKLITKTLEDCAHTIEIPCFQSKDMDNVRCSAPCGLILDCGHACTGPCSSCRYTDPDSGETQVKHGGCKQKCGRLYSTCQHACQATCHSGEACGLCEAPCGTRCSHSKCGKKCHEPCTPCAEKKCSSSCTHSKCTMPCGAPCDWLPCEQRCAKTLTCGHQCPSACGEACPPKDFCQICGNEDVKSQIVDFILGDTYGNVNLDDDPCIFPHCGHFFTRSSMDGVMDMQSHYEMDADGKIANFKARSEPFTTDMRKCPTCRGSLRDISRYGRLVRRALLDESSKRLITFAQEQYTKLQESAFHVEEATTATQEQRPIDSALILSGTRNNQMKQVTSLSLWTKENQKTLKLREQVANFVRTIRKEEQPYVKVKTMIDDALRRREQNADTMLIGMVQHRHFLLGSTLLLRLDLAILSSVIELKRSSTTAFANFQNKDRLDFIVDLSTNREASVELAKTAQESTHPRSEAEGHILVARFAALELSVVHCSRGGNPPKGREDRFPGVDELRAEGLAHLDQAEKICEANEGSTNGLAEEIDATRKMLISEFYQPVNNEERRQVLAAMASEFSGTGHWYTCENGHPFTIGECGRPMQQARCPQCGVGIGGQHHQLAEGVQRAQDLDREAGEVQRGMGRLNLG